MKRLLLSVMSVVMSASVWAAEPETLSFTLDNSTIYPGTSRTIKVYVPSAYDGSRPACLAVMMDDIMYGLTDAMEQLYSEGKMPLTIAVGVTPGKITDPDGNVTRYNRSNEFDRTDGVFASFLESEVLPEVAKQVTSDGRKVLISDRPEDRMALGASSGAIAAFAAAYNRPDLFSRVYSIVGTYVPMRGADLLPGLVRKSEPRKVRFFLQDNDKDSWNLLFGSWYEYNLLMNSALEFAGYEVRHSWDQGGHNGNNGAAHMKEALEFLWKGWPQAVGTARTGNGSLEDVLDPSVIWTEGLAGGAFRPATKAAVYPGGDHIARIEGADNWVMNYTRAKSGSLSNGEQFYYLYSPARAVAFDNEGYLYCLTDSGIEVCDQNGRVRVVISTPYGAKVTAFQLRANTLVVRTSDGRYYTRTIRRHSVEDPLSVPAPKSEGQG